jgi:hypothetical protein
MKEGVGWGQMLKSWDGQGGCKQGMVQGTQEVSTLKKPGIYRD